MADEVLADPIFDRAEPGILARARDWVFERIADVLEVLFAGSGGGVLGYVLAGLVAVAAVVLVVRFTRALRSDQAAPATVGAIGRPATDWLAEAARHEAVGEWPAALRCRYRALVASLAERDLLAEVPGRTAGEYRRAVARSSPAMAPAFDGATSLFERAWYGGADVGVDDARHLEALTAEVMAGAGDHR